MNELIIHSTIRKTQATYDNNYRRHCRIVKFPSNINKTRIKQQLYLKKSTEKYLRRVDFVTVFIDVKLEIHLQQYLTCTKNHIP